MALVILMVSVLVLSGLALSSDVLELGDSDFDFSVRQHETMLVEFFAPWCGHCKKLAPEYEEAATRLKDIVPLAKVDCTANSETCTKFGVNGYPTLKIFRNGEESSAYDGPRSADGIVSHMKKQAGPSSVELKTAKDLEKFISHYDASIVGFFSSSDSAQLAEYVKAASELRDHYRLAHTSIPELLEAHNILGEGVILFRPPRLSNKFEESTSQYSDSISTSSIRSFINENIFGMCPHMTSGNKEQLMRRDILLVFYNIDYVRNPKGSNYWRNRVMKVASKFVSEGRTLSFAVADRQEFAEELSEFGVEDTTGELPVVVIKTLTGEKYIMQDEFTRDGLALEHFVEDYFAKNLKRYVKSEPIPEKNDGPVKVVVAETFDEIVNDQSKDVLIEFYAPWCGHCKNLEPKYIELGQQLANDPNIIIAKMDATANDIPSNYDVQGFPTIYFATKGNKESPKRYEGGREVSDFINFLKSEASTSPVISPIKEDL
ncbi:protein disulfide isomerase family A, member 7 [Polypterus senegalus]|uniref:protein disulfide isomerase family A, member 7 n=1 Tax=Polypterus senegalus TaxID=55291 RepID=UPI0019669512|nr:protein disulfide isomerase family A, member 7 [Polypterus senegalus]